MTVYTFAEYLQNQNAQHAYLAQFVRFYFALSN